MVDVGDLHFALEIPEKMRTYKSSINIILIFLKFLYYVNIEKINNVSNNFFLRSQHLFSLHTLATHLFQNIYNKHKT